MRVNPNIIRIRTRLPVTESDSLEQKQKIRWVKYATYPSGEIKMGGGTAIAKRPCDVGHQCIAIR